MCYSCDFLGEDIHETRKKIKSGDEAYLDAVPYGHFTLDRFDSGGDLWLFSTGTGVAPYLCMLQQENIWNNFSTITLVCSFRDQTQFVYWDTLPLELEKLTDFQSKNYKKFSAAESIEVVRTLPPLPPVGSTSAYILCPVSMPGVSFKGKPKLDIFFVTLISAFSILLCCV